MLSCFVLKSVPSQIRKPVYLQIYTNFCPRYFKQSDLMDRAILQASDRLRKKFKFWGIFRDRFAELFGANFAKKQSGKKGPISWEFSGQISLEIDRFYADLISVFFMFFSRDNHLLF